MTGRGAVRRRGNDAFHDVSGRRSRSRSPIRGGPRKSFGGARERNNRMVFITNISYDVRWMELKTLVREKGGEVNFLEMLEDRDGKPKGNAIVEFETREGAELCCEQLKRYEFKGRALVAKEIRDPVAFLRKVKEETGFDFLAKTGHSSRDDTARPQRSGTYDLFGLSPEFLRKHHIEPPLCDRVFIANLSYNVGTGRIYEIFGLAGKIVWMDLHMDKEGRSKGVCVVQFSHPIEAVQAISMFNGQRLYDRTLAVKMDRFEKIEKPQEGGLPRGLEALGMGLGVDGAPLKDVSSLISAITPHESAQQIKTEPYTSPAHYGTNARAGATSFGNAYPSADSSYDRMGGSLTQSLNSALGLPISGNSPTVYGNNGLGANSAFQSGTYNTSSAFSPDFKGSASSYGMGMQYRPSPVVLIKNLPVDYTWQIVRDRVQQFGDIETVDIVSPGVARIRFVRIQDAERMRTALSGTSVEGRPITVDFI